MTSREKPYHQYVFDSENREFVGRFEEMYRNEATERFDSWNQEDLTPLKVRIAATVLDGYNFENVLDVGCGKGTFTHLLKKANNRVTGIDLSQAAIERAGSKYPDVDFVAGDVNLGLTRLDGLEGPYDLVVMMEILSYLERWKAVIEDAFRLCDRLFVSLYLPEDPIGYVKSFRDLCDVIERKFVIEHHIVLDERQLLLMARDPRMD